MNYLFLWKQYGNGGRLDDEGWIPCVDEEEVLKHIEDFNTIIYDVFILNIRREEMMSPREFGMFLEADKLEE